MDRIEEEIFNQLYRMTKNDFKNCYSLSQDENKFYSPFILGLIGIFLVNSNIGEKDFILESIQSKLVDTYNQEGIYNFYGNKEYFFDVDTTSIVNTFFRLRNIYSNKYHSDVISKLIKNSERGGEAVKTWLNRPRNNVDWFVNYNFCVYSNLVEKTECFVQKFLKNERDDFFENGSRYYSNTTFPLFYILFTKKEFQINLIDIPSKLVEQSSTDLLNFGIKSLKDKSVSMEKKESSFTDFLNSRSIYFNSSEHFFSSRELNAAILLYLIHKFENNG